jgi:sRNA-binding protein
MNPKQNDYQVLKRYMYAMKDFSERIDGNGVNGMIADAHQAAYDSLPLSDRRWVEAASKRLQSKCKNLGEKGALEVLATLGQLIVSTGQGGEVSAMEVTDAA